MGQKWQSTAGPRQTKAVDKALSAVVWAGKSRAELVGPKSKPSRHVLTNVFGDCRADVLAALAKLREDFGGEITRDNCREIIARAGILQRQAEESMPVEDLTTTPAQDAERAEERRRLDLQRQAEAEQHAAAARDVGAELRKRYPWAVPARDGLSEHARAAKNLKIELSRAFPGVGFRVRSDSFSMGDSVDVGWELGPTGAQVEAISGKYQYGHFDGMEDIYRHDKSAESTAVGKVLGQAKYVQAQRSFADDLQERVGRDLCELQGVEYAGWETRNLCGAADGEWLRTHVYRLLARTGFAIGEQYAGVRYTTEEERAASEEVNDWATIIKTGPAARPDAPASGASIGGATIEKHHHTKRGVDFWLVVLADRVERPTFEKIRAECKAAGGWYSRKWGTTPGGFAFDTEADAQAFAGTLAAEPATA